VGGERGLPEEMAQAASFTQSGGSKSQRELSPEERSNAAMQREVEARNAARAASEQPKPVEYLTSKFDSEEFVKAAMEGQIDPSWARINVEGALKANVAVDLGRRVQGGHLDGLPWFEFPRGIETRGQKLGWAQDEAARLTDRLLEDTALHKACGRLASALISAGLSSVESKQVTLYAAMNEMKTQFPDPFGIQLDRSPLEVQLGEDKGRLNDPADGLLDLMENAAAGDGGAAQEASQRLQNLFVSKRRELAEITL